MDVCNQFIKFDFGSSAADIESLKEENKQLTEENLIRSGETSILRADLMQLRKLMEKRDADASKQLDVLKRQIKDMDTQHNKQLEASRTEMKFKVTSFLKNLGILNGTVIVTEQHLGT